MSDSEKFELLYEQYRKLTLYIARAIVKNDADAEDAVQQAFSYIWQNIDKIDDVDSPQTKSYVATAVQHRAIDIVRYRKRFVELDEQVLGYQPPPSEGCGLFEAMDMLTDRYRKVLILHYAQGYDTSEIAELLGMKRGTVQKLLWRAKEQLAKKLEKQSAV